MKIEDLLRENDRLQIKVEASQKAYMSLLRDYTELKNHVERMEKAFKEVRNLLDFLIDNNYASKDPEEKGCYTTKEGINRGPTRISDYTDFYTNTTDYPTTTILC